MEWSSAKCVQNDMTAPSSAVGAALAARLSLRGRTAKPDREAHAPLISFRTGVPSLDPEDIAFSGQAGLEMDGLRVGSLVDISGQSGAGKTALLHYIAAHIVAPPSFEDFKIHTRREADVIWIDLNGGFDCEIFAKSLRATCPSGVNQEQMVLDCLERVHIYRPYSSISLLATLHSLRNFVESPQGKNVRALVIDALGMHHHCDAVKAERDSNRENGAGDDMEQAFVTVLRRLLKDTQLTCFASKCTLYDSKPLATAWPFDARLRPSIPQEFLPSTWSTLVTQAMIICDSPPNRYVVFLSKSTPDGTKANFVPSGIAQFTISENCLRFGAIERARI